MVSSPGDAVSGLSVSTSEVSWIKTIHPET